MSNWFKKSSVIPSFYGLCSWIISGVFAIFKPLDLNLSLDFLLIYIYIILNFVLIYINSYSKIKIKIINNSLGSMHLSEFDRFIFLLSSTIGIVGLIKYITDFAAISGGLSNFFIYAATDLLQIRGLQAEDTSIGFQLSYFSWIAIFYCIYYIFKDNHINTYRIIFYKLLLILLFIGNLLFADRTRPIIIFLCSFFIIYLIKFKKINNNLKWITYLLLVPVAFFFFYIIFTGKYDIEDNNGLINNFLVYLTGGFGYLSALISESSGKFTLENTLYPIYKIAQMLGLVDTVMPQVMVFKSVPYETNVGTFVAPLYLDGGLLFSLLMIPLILFMIDLISIKSLLSGRVFGLFISSTLIMNNLLSSITPKFNNLFLYIFLFIYFLFFKSKKIK